MRALCKARGVDLPEACHQIGKMPELLTPGAAEAIAVKTRRLMITGGVTAEEALSSCLDGYLPPISPAVIQSQIQLAIDEASDASFIPEMFRR